MSAGLEMLPKHSRRLQKTPEGFRRLQKLQKVSAPTRMVQGQDPQEQEAAWQRGPHATDGPHNYIHEAHIHKPETRMIADEFWHANGKPRQMTDVHTFRFNKHLVNEGMGRDAYEIHKKVPCVVALPNSSFEIFHCNFKGDTL